MKMGKDNVFANKVLEINSMMIGLNNHIFALSEIAVDQQIAFDDMRQQRDALRAQRSAQEIECGLNHDKGLSVEDVVSLIDRHVMEMETAIGYGNPFSGKGE